jgi:Zn-dependent peptidase ImmA (M78 family)
VSLEDETRAIAERVRLGIGPTDPIHNLLELIEVDAGIPVIVLGLGNEGLAGAYMQRRGTPFILVNGSNHVVRMRFTLGHEFAHHTLGHRQSWDKANYFFSKDPQEVGANAFAAEFLLPRQAVVQWHERRGGRAADLEAVARLGHEYGISALAALFRLDAAVSLSPALKRRLDRSIRDGEHLSLPQRPSWPHRHDSLEDAQNRERRLPNAAETILVGAVIKGVLSSAHAAGHLGIEESEVQRMLAAYTATDE